MPETICFEYLVIGIWNLIILVTVRLPHPPRRGETSLASLSGRSGPSAGWLLLTSYFISLCKVCFLQNLQNFFSSNLSGFVFLFLVRV